MKICGESRTLAAAYGGAGWQHRKESVREEIGKIWHRCGVNAEWSRLKAILLHQPGQELAASVDWNAVQMLAPLDALRARQQHSEMTRAFERAGVTVHRVQPDELPLPNQMFVADLLFMTPEGAVVARPASSVRAGEERWVARRLAEMGIPIVASIHGTGTFEGADAAWLSPKAVMLGRGLRTNREGARQVTEILGSLGVKVIQVDMPLGAMHLMGMLRFVDRDLAIAWPGRIAVSAVETLQDYGYQVAFLPDEVEAKQGMALNFVTLGPREILMPAGNEITRAFYEVLGITCRTVAVDELIKAAGAIGCLTGILEREIVS